MTRILVTGSSGYLGSHLCRLFDMDNIKVFAIYKNLKPQFGNVEPIQLDLLNSEELNILYRDFKPDYVIHLAAVIPSQVINQDEKYVYQMNVELTRQIASLSHTYNSFLIFTSSDLVYDEGDDIKEDHILNPLNLYAHTKLEAEKSVIQYGKYYLILRVALMYGFSISMHKSFFDFSFKQLMKRQVVNAFYDQFRNALFVEEAAKFLKHFTEIKLPEREIMNFCGFEKISRYEMVFKTAEVFGFDLRLVQKESCESFKEYKMVKNLGLNFDKMIKLNLIHRTFLENLKQLKENFEFYKKFIEDEEEQKQD
ncbi:MAG: NAD(P)-dependent oxidoreductase [Ignavibacterium sp.]|jgi:dTDP-4-dehydrorhamnose reductase|nr:SDR family oxidoreductase [Ignavibacteria bacterium]MDH7527316.1 SDR family oxidoreductase [Ignavibacteria bacterium]GIV45343.1 MAG: NAD(P)-dependent oxidoreductase [Ignavibacterium sp.]